MTDHICIGDYVVLYNERRSGYVAALNSSDVFNNPFVYCNQDPGHPRNVPNMAALVFEVCICSRFKVEKKYRRLLSANESRRNADPDKDETTIRIESAAQFDFDLDRLKGQAELEASDNMKESKRNQGRKIRFGEIVQLRNIYTKKYLHIDNENMSAIQRSSMRTCILPLNGKSAQFIIQPTYKVNAEGEFILDSAYVSFESVKVRGHFLHASAPISSDVEIQFQEAELNVGVEKNGFLIQKSRCVNSSLSVNPTRSERSAPLKGLDYVHFYHQEMEAYICAEGAFMGTQSEDIHLRVRPLDPKIVRSLMPSTNPNTYWQIEKEKQSFNCNEIDWQDQVRFRHGSTRMYLSVMDDNQLTLVSNSTDPRTVFKFIPVNPEFAYQEFVRVGRNVCVMHVVSKKWLRAENEIYTKRVDADDDDIMSTVVWDNSQLFKLYLDDNKRYDDAFKVEPLQEGCKDEMDYISGFVPPIYNFYRSCMAQEPIPTSTILKNTFALKELKTFLLVNHEPVKRRQKILRSFQLIDMLMCILENKPPNSTNYSAIIWSNLSEEIYGVVLNYLAGSSRKNNLYLAKHFSKLHSQMVTLGNPNTNSLSKWAIMTLTQLVRGNRQIVNCIKSYHIDDVIKLLCGHKSHLYLIFLAEICVCKGVALPENQNYILKKWLMGDAKGMYLLARGQNIDRTNNMLYVTPDNSQSWIMLHMFVDHLQPSYKHKHVLFLMHQFDLFVALCAGRNSTAIHLITKEKEFITWDQAFTSLTSDIMPDQMRSKLCEVIIGLFVNVGGNYSVVEHTVTSVEFQRIGGNRKSMTYSLTHKDLSSIFPLLKKWIIEFLNENISMHLYNVDRNRLLFQVFNLLGFLVKYGYFDEANPIAELIKPIIDVLDGRSDTHILPHKDISIMSHEERKPFDIYRRRGRFKKNFQNSVLVKAKCAGLDVLELIMICLESNQLKSLMVYFKASYQFVDYSDGKDPLLNPPQLRCTLDEHFDPYSPDKLHRKIQNQMQMTLKDMFNEKEYFDIDALQAVLLDLTHYEYDNLLQKSVTVLARYFSSRSSVFNMAKNSILLENEESCEFNSLVSTEAPKLIVLINSRWDGDNAAKLTAMMEKLSQSCKIENSHLPNPINQRILSSNNMVNVLFEVFERDLEDIVLSSHAESVYKCSLNFLAAICEENEAVKNVIFDRLDTLLEIKLARLSLLNLLKVLFSQRADLCEQLTVKQIEKVFVMIDKKREKREPKLLEVIYSFGRVKGSNTLIKKNMLVIIKAMMQKYRNLDDLFDLDNDERIQILMNGQTSDCHFYVNLVYLLATCAELENEFIESFCQTFITLEDVLKILITVKDPFVKRVFMKFLNEVFVKTAMSSSETGASDIATFLDFWPLIEIILKDTMALLENIEEMTGDYIMDRMSDCACERLYFSDDESIDWDVTEDGMKINEENKAFLYFLDGVVPLLTEVYSVFHATETNFAVEERQKFIRLTKCVIEVLENSTPYIINANQGEVAVKFGQNSIDVGFANRGDIQAMVNCIGSYLTENPTKERRIFDAFSERHHDEIELNNKFDQFAENCRKIYEGHNTAEAQLGTVTGSSKDFVFDQKAYTPLDQIESLPLGEEFQQLCHAFIIYTEDAIKRRYANLKVLITQLRISQKMSHLHGRAFKKQSRLDIVCCQVLRAVLHNEILRLINWPQSQKSSYNRDQLTRIHSLQDTLISFNIMDALLPLTREAHGDTSKQVFALLKVLHFNTSPMVQKSVYNYFTETSIECFFYSIKCVFGSLIDDVKEVQNRFSIRMQEKREKERSHAMRRESIQNMDLSCFEEAKLELTNSRHSVCIFKCSTLKNKSVVESGYAYLVFEVISGMCDVQFTPLQEYFRVQSDNPKSYNIVSEMCNVMATLYSSINPAYCYHLTQLLDTLRKLCVGNYENLMTILNGKIVDYMNYILRSVDFPGCDPLEVLNLREALANLLIVLIEQDSPEFSSLGKEIMVTVDSTAIMRLMNQCYRLSKTEDLPDLEELVKLMPEEAVDQSCIASCNRCCRRTYHQFNFEIKQLLQSLQERLYEVGFKHFLVISRFFDLDPEYERSQIESLTEDNGQAYRGFKRGSHSIEIIKDDHLQKMTFRVKNPNLLREAVREKILWSVDRSSISTKIRDFTSWINSVLIDIDYTRRVLKNPFVIFFTSLWYVWNNIPVLISCAISILALVKITKDTNSKLFYKADPILDNSDGSATYIQETLHWLGLVHSIMCLCLFISYLMNTHPNFDNVKNLGTTIKSFLSPLSKWYKRLIRKKKKARLAKEAKSRGYVNLAHERNETMLEEDDDYMFVGDGESIECSSHKDANVHLDGDCDKTKRFDNYLAEYVFSFRTLYYVALLALSITGTVMLFHNDMEGTYFFAAHLLNICVVNQELNGIIKAIYKVLPALASVGLLIVVILYCFALIGFLFMRDAFFAGKDDEGMVYFYCDTFAHCFVTLIRYGFLFDKWTDFYLMAFKGSRNFMNFVPYAFYTIFLFIGISIIMYNIITGIIVDKFAEIRKNKWAQEQDMRENCFICGRTSYEFETQAKGFRYHIQNEHNMWAYMHLFIYLHDTKPGDLTSLQLYVKLMILDQQNDFYPISRAISLNRADDVSDDIKIEEANNIVKGLLDTADIMNLEKERFAEYVRQKYWYEEMRPQLPTGQRDRRPSVLTMNNLFPHIIREMQINSEDSREVLLEERIHKARSKPAPFTDEH